MKVLNQIIAMEKGIKSRNYGGFTEIHKVASKLDLFNGFVKTYKKKDEEGEDYPQEKKKVTSNVQELIGNASKLLTETFDITPLLFPLNNSSARYSQNDLVNMSNTILLTELFNILPVYISASVQ
jgi:hypothetical protein